MTYGISSRPKKSGNDASFYITVKCCRNKPYSAQDDVDNGADRNAWCQFSHSGPSAQNLRVADDLTMWSRNNHSNQGCNRPCRGNALSSFKTHTDDKSMRACLTHHFRSGHPRQTSTHATMQLVNTMTTPLNEGRTHKYSLLIRGGFSRSLANLHCLKTSEKPRHALNKIRKHWPGL